MLFNCLKNVVINGFNEETEIHKKFILCSNMIYFLIVFKDAANVLSKTFTIVKIKKWSLVYTSGVSWLRLTV